MNHSVLPLHTFHPLWSMLTEGLARVSRLKVWFALCLLLTPFTLAHAQNDRGFGIEPAVRKTFSVPEAFTKGLEAYGVPVVGTPSVSGGHLLEATLFLHALCQAYPDLAKTLSQGQHYIGLVSNDKELAQHPDARQHQNSQGMGWPISETSRSIVWVLPPPTTKPNETSEQNQTTSEEAPTDGMEGLWASSLAHLGIPSTKPVEWDGSLAREAGDHGDELARTWQACDPDCRAGLAFLLEHMPESDRKSLTRPYLLEHVHVAYESWKQAPWKDQITEEMFFDWILPYANVNESRDAWRADFRKRFLPLVQEAKTPGEAATWLNQKIFGILDVRYSTQRRRPDQGPYESIETHLASCSGLSILLIDACRSVGVPARFVGTPKWSDNSGNHSWVEVWSEGSWHFTGACEPAGDRLNEGWFTGRASEAKADDPRYAIYAASFRRTPIHFPLVWNMRDRSVYGINITQRYLKQDRQLEEGLARIRFCVRDAKTNARVKANITLHDQEGSLVLEGKSRDDGFDSNDHLEAVVRLGGSYEVSIDGEPAQTIQALAPNQLFTFHLE